MAPEALITGLEVDGRADLYAVGVMLYQMLTGNIPRGSGLSSSASLCVATGTELHLVRPMGFVLSDRELKRATMQRFRGK